MNSAQRGRLVNLNDAGVPPLAFVQMLESHALDPDVVARLRDVMAREGTDEATLIRRDIQAPLRWFREVYPDLDVDQGNPARLRVRRTGPVDVLRPVECSAGQCRLGSRDRGAAHLSAADHRQPSIHSSIRMTTASPSGSADTPAIRRWTAWPSPTPGRRCCDCWTCSSGDAPTVTLHVGWPAPVAPACSPGRPCACRAPVLRRSDVLSSRSRGHARRGVPLLRSPRVSTRRRRAEAHTRPAAAAPRPSRRR